MAMQETGSEKGIIKKSEMNANTTYLLCPDKTCRLFFDVSGTTPCEDRCPRQDDLVKIIKCSGCGEPIDDVEFVK